MDQNRSKNFRQLPSANLRVAIFYDWLNQWGGAERVLLNILKIYPRADLFTIVYDPSAVKWLPPTKVKPSFINKLPLARNNPIFYTPLYDIALEQFDFSSYDIVISTTSTIGHCLLTPPSTLFVTYFHNINRHLYRYNFLKFYQKIDYIYSRRPDAVLCNSRTVSARIQKEYRLTPRIIHPGVNTDFFRPSSISLNKYFLIVGRLVNHKRFDIVIKAFLKNSLPLIIIGSGRKKNTLKKIAGRAANIKFIDPVSDYDLLNYYQNCLALICPQLEDFGLSAIEAQACGKPVIAYGRGGNTETIINGKTGIFFPAQTPESLQSALVKFSSAKFNSQLIRRHSIKFSQDTFMLNFKKTIDQLWQKHQTTTF